jgi:hypothetical protein
MSMVYTHFMKIYLINSKFHIGDIMELLNELLQCIFCGSVKHAKHLIVRLVCLP